MAACESTVVCVLIEKLAALLGAGCRACLGRPRDDPASSAAAVKLGEDFPMPPVVAVDSWMVLDAKS